MRKLLTGVALVVPLCIGQAYAADQQTNQTPPLATSGEPGTVQCYIMAPDKTGKYERTTVTMYGKNDPGGPTKYCAELK
jgi:hypothetical protein